MRPSASVAGMAATLGFDESLALRQVKQEA